MMSDFRSGPGWAEYDPTSAPQVVIPNAPEVVNQDVHIPMNNLTANDRVLKSNDGANDGNGASPLTLLQRLRPHRWIITIVAVLLLVGIVAGVTVPMVQKSNAYSRGSYSSMPSTSSSALITTTAPSSATSTATATPSASQGPGCDSSKFISDVSWIGIDKGRDWKYRLKPAKSPEDCCTICHQSIPEGCNGWLFVKTNTNTPNCNLIYGYSGPNKTNACPAGKPDLVYNDGDGQGGGGPCAEKIRV
ncbi:hypothetical protein CkaCkLH20_13246 [Colletotrichum karsti]|uniref:Apple domain-containing protein n=1 Tax=Colletotrichum karsti TaxID=1095194 RepID=A0A9P6HSZ0_9PEZI|nr:uncharacterized protein CkaCkLH20_13246 [Colletotrichum karsti]KAF9869285.1 hypothetical protein CkaCkLH20_13246 [Colletotrichum karsti]